MWEPVWPSRAELETDVPRLPYSVVFIERQGLDGAEAYEVPEGRVAVARCLDVYSANEDVLNTTLRFIDGLTGGTIWLHDWGVTTTGWAQWTGRQVFPPLGRLVLQSQNGLVDARLSGYLLTQL